VGRSRKTVTNAGMTARSGQLPERERAEEKGQLEVRDGDELWDPRYFHVLWDRQRTWERGHERTVRRRGLLHSRQRATGGL